jgi:uncharacterized membrane protein
MTLEAAGMIGNNTRQGREDCAEGFHERVWQAIELHRRKANAVDA